MKKNSTLATAFLLALLFVSTSWIFAYYVAFLIALPAGGISWMLTRRMSSEETPFRRVIQGLLLVGLLLFVAAAVYFGKKVWF